MRRAGRRGGSLEDWQIPGIAARFVDGLGDPVSYSRQLVGVRPAVSRLAGPASGRNHLAVAISPAAGRRSGRAGGLRGGGGWAGGGPACSGLAAPPWARTPPAVAPPPAAPRRRRRAVGSRLVPNTDREV